MLFLIFRRDYLRSTSGIIFGSGSFAVQFGDHLRSGIIYFAALYSFLLFSCKLALFASFKGKYSFEFRV